MSGSATPGWYPVQGDPRLRWWDGSQWTEQFLEDPQGEVAQGVAGRPAHGSHAPGDAIWSANGRPVTGIGAGRYWLTPHHLFFEKGALRTDSQQVPVSALLDVDVRQSMTQKARGVFTVLVHIQRGSGVEVVSMDDIPNGREAQRIINETAHNARLAIQRNQNTMRYEGQPPQFATAPTAAASSTSGSAPAAPDLMDQLRKLGELRDAGVLTEEEFAAKKADILSRL